MMRKDLVFNLKEDEKEYLKQVKENMYYLEEEQMGIFGDEEKLAKYRRFNMLEDWEKNLLILYSKYKSFNKVAERLNVQKSTTAMVINEITKKINYIINNDKNINTD